MNINIQNIKEIQNILVERQSLEFKRFLFDKIDFSQQLIGIIGPRGVGKTTLILQYLKENFFDNDEAIYFLADNVLLQKGDLVELAREFHLKHGINLICIDEIHRFHNWNQELKNIYDTLPDLKIIFSGSSSLDLIKGKYDLSRRGIIYNLPGFSFREFLLFFKKVKIENFCFEYLIKNFKNLSKEISKEKKILKYFNEYLLCGYYPFFNETKSLELYKVQISNIIDKIIYEDIASFYSLKTQNLITFKQILYFFATTTPGEVNINKLASSLKKNHATISEYLKILQEASLVRFLTNDKMGHSLVRHAEKIYLDNTNILQVIGSIIGKNINNGMLRELFFLNQLQNSKLLPCYTETGDFVVNDYTFEIGGKNKNDKQIQGVKNSYLVLDDILIGDEKKIPLYLFGFLY
ncbi:ATP-binding protein [Candidatus Parcubacteria bacterium]|nr:ATP-binding protein [Candidatus Parcubacteria bacterium]